MQNSPKNYPSHFPKSKKEESEFGKGREDILLCRGCNAVYFYKSWHHKLEDYPKLKESKRLKFTLCPACRMIKDKKFEGEVFLEDIPEKFKKEVINTIKNVGKEALRKDIQDRIISIYEIGRRKIRVLTTENQLAVRIGKKIKDSYPSKIEIQHSKKESTVRIKVIFS